MGAKIRCEICDKEFMSQEAIDSHNKAKHNMAKKSKSRFPTKTVAIIAVVLIAIVGVVALSISGNKSPNINSNVINTPVQEPVAQAPVSSQAPDNAQTAKLSVSGSNYILQPSTFKKGVPVKIIADIGRMPGCSKVVTIPAFNVFKSVSDTDNIITFTPTKTGTFKMVCTMNMYTTTFTVE
jgi:hypothetical protein